MEMGPTERRLMELRPMELEPMELEPMELRPMSVDHARENNDESISR